jgi:hypothetical protein
MRNHCSLSSHPLGRARATLGSVLLTLLFAGGCSSTLTSPPGHALHLATPASAGKGNTLVTAAVGGGGEPFGPGVVAGELRARHGVAKSTDVGVTAAAVGLVGEHDFAIRHHAGIYSLRAFAHHELVPRFVALHAGVAGGGSAGGGFLSPDVGLTLGFENPHVVPYVSGTFFVSSPLTKNTLDMRKGNDTSDLREPYLSFGPRLGTGIRIPIGPRGSPLGSIVFECGGTWLYGDDPADDRGRGLKRAFLMLGAGYQAHFGGRASLR